MILLRGVDFWERSKIVFIWQIERCELNVDDIFSPISGIAKNDSGPLRLLFCCLETLEPAKKLKT